MIPARIANGFPQTIRTEGDEYFRAHRVRVVTSDGEQLTAQVRGSAPRTVQLFAEHDIVAGNCTCPYFASNGRCRHIWAALRQADHEGTLHALVETAGPKPEFIDAEIGVDEPTTRAVQGPPEWRTLLEIARRHAATASPNGAPGHVVWPDGRRLVYIVDVDASKRTTGIVIEVATEGLGPDGEWKRPARMNMSLDVWQAAPDARDREIAQMLIGASRPNLTVTPAAPSVFILGTHALGTTLPLLCSTDRCRVRFSRAERPTDPIAWDDGEPWTLSIRMKRVDADNFVTGVLRRGEEEMPLAEPALVHPSGVLLARGAFARFDDGGAYGFVTGLRAGPHVRVPQREMPAFLESLYSTPRRPHVELPADVEITEVREAPQPGVEIQTDGHAWGGTHNTLKLFFTYGDTRVYSADPAPSTFDAASQTVRHRDYPRERAAAAMLADLGVREEWHHANADAGRALTIATVKSLRLVFTLVSAGWRVEEDGVRYRNASPGRAYLSSGVDWFELHATVRYGDIDVPLGQVLAAQRAGAGTIVLPDGSHGLLPFEWLARLGPLAAGGTASNGALRYTHSQAALLDALLEVLPDTDIDETFERARTELRTFATLAPADPPSTFEGTLREYQREGLAWFHFLAKFGLGGCLADDMGLGKTIQVLALLDERRSQPKDIRRPSLVVVPRSLVFNWTREAERFTPDLRLLDYTGSTRDATKIVDADLVITTYGTLRRDAAKLAAFQFDYVILDEAQAIKTATSSSAKAARLLRAHHRLALTGTPIENRLEELWSLLEFLNPGMLGASNSFSSMIRLSSEIEEPAERDLLARALRPVILRRTKAQVARDLPERLEQTLTVDLEGPQRKFYDEMLATYRASVIDRIDRVGLGKSKMHILEALLRLRQAACHPVLADPRKINAPSAKLDALIPQLEEVVAEGHKALVFSQFTSFLALVRTRLEAAKIPFEYLDGKTRDRQARVDRFQNDPACPVFLISIKAGGHGLNLTAAEYVFILDPWWNPAVEAQAIDRAHRIGQTQRVIASRIVARNTIEEKILQLQASKRALADAILGQDQGVLSGIGREELEMLLG